MCTCIIIHVLHEYTVQLESFVIYTTCSRWQHFFSYEVFVLCYWQERRISSYRARLAYVTLLGVQHLWSTQWNVLNQQKILKIVCNCMMMARCLLGNNSFQATLRAIFFFVADCDIISCPAHGQSRWEPGAFQPLPQALQAGLWVCHSVCTGEWTHVEGNMICVCMHVWYQVSECGFVYVKVRERERERVREREREIQINVLHTWWLDVVPLPIMCY